MRQPENEVAPAGDPGLAVDVVQRAGHLMDRIAELGGDPAIAQATGDEEGNRRLAPAQNDAGVS